MVRYYDEEHHRLIYVGEAATEQFWDGHWKTEDFRRAITATPNSWVAKTTAKYLSKGSRILEGGCGSANHVYALQKRDFKAVGLDFAPNTVARLKEAAPELDIRLGDVRALPFDDSEFDGYWSLGVIEHFWDGYDDIAKEMHRVLRGGGYLFLTFPYMSPLRTWKARRGRYAPWRNGEKEPAGFYQFALDPSCVKHFFIDMGFDLVFQSGFDGLKGLKDEMNHKQAFLQNLYESKNIKARILRKLFNSIFGSLYGHSCLLVLRKTIGAYRGNAY